MNKKRKEEILKKLTIHDPKGLGGIPAYDIEEIQKALTEEEAQSFGRFISGQTGRVLEGNKFGVYTYDFERFLDGRPVID